jgi:hypothetical protein
MAAIFMRAYCAAMQDALQRLGLRAGGFDTEALKKAFLRESLRIHPDRGGTDQEFRLLVDSYKQLKVFLSASTPPPLHNESKDNVTRQTQTPTQTPTRNMDPAAFNKAFSSTHNRDTHGHGDWLATARVDVQPKISFKHFHKTFQKKAQQRSMSLVVKAPPVVPSAGCSLSPLLTIEEQSGANVDYSSPPAIGRASTLAYTDIKVTHDQHLVDPTHAVAFAAKKNTLLQDDARKRMR